MQITTFEEEKQVAGAFDQFEYFGTIFPINDKAPTHEMIKNAMEKHKHAEQDDVIIYNSTVIDNGRTVYVRKYLDI